MSTDLETIEQLLRTRLSVVQSDGDRLFIPMSIAVYQSAGRATLPVRLAVLDEGRLVSAYVPSAFVVAGAHSAAVVETLLRAQSRHPLVRYVYDPEDGEVRPLVEIPVMDGDVTVDQLLAAIVQLVVAVDWIFPAVMVAGASGRILSTASNSEQLRSLVARLAEFSAEQLSALLDAIGPAEVAA